MNKLRERPYFYVGLVAVILFWLIYDCLPLFTQYPFLWGLNRVDLCQYEMTITYLPMIGSFSWSHLFPSSFTGNTAHYYSLFPHFSIFIFGIAKTFANGDINRAIALVHALLIYQYWIVYRVWKHITDDDRLCTITALAVVIQAQILQPNLYALLLLSGALYFGLLRLSKKAKLWQIPVAIGVSIIAFLGIFRLGLHQTYFTTYGGTRIISSLIQLSVFLTAIDCLIRFRNKLINGEKIGIEKSVLIAVIVALNVYTYYINIPLIAVTVATMLWSLPKSVLVAQKQALIAFCVTGLVASTPFLVGLYLTKHSLAHSEYLFRAAITPGLIPFRQFAWPALGIAGVATILTHRRKKFPFELYLFWGLIVTCFIIKYINHFSPNAIPSPWVVDRMVLPLTTFCLMVPLSVWATESKLKQKDILFNGIIVGLSTKMILIGVGLFNVHRLVSGPANRALYDTMQTLKPWVSPQDLLLTDSVSPTIIAPSVIGCRTLVPDQLTTIGTDRELFSQYIQYFKILGLSKRHFIHFVAPNDMDPSYEWDKKQTYLITHLSGPPSAYRPECVTANLMALEQEFDATSPEASVENLKPFKLFISEDRLKRLPYLHGDILMKHNGRVLLSIL